MLQLLAPAARAETVSLLLAGPHCPDAAVLAAATAAVRPRTAVPQYRVANAIARVRAQSALVRARSLYTRTRFAACISLLSISELELSRALATPDPELRQRGHRLLSRLLLWLGICQWASGEPQAAASTFVRSAQLPSSPAPDPALLPPELVSAFRDAVTAPRQQVSCTVAPPLRAADLLLDGKGPTLAGADRITTTAGSHQLVLSCHHGPRCEPLTRYLGPGGLRALRLEAAPQRCQIRAPAVPVAHPTPCVSLAEARDVTFVSAVTRASGAHKTLVVLRHGQRVALKLHTRGRASFQHQLVSTLGPGEQPGQVIGRSAAVLLSSAPAQPSSSPPPSPASADRPWYGRWWVWTAAGTVVLAGIVTAVVVSSSDHRMQVVFGP